MLKNLLGSSRRFVLVFGNRGAILVFVEDGKVTETWSINDLEDASLAILTDALDDRRRVPLSVLVDMLEQSYRREAIPPVNMLDRPKVLNRRLGIAFPAFDIKAALSLGEEVGQRGDLAYLFVALPPSPELESWIAFFHSIDNPISSLGLLPIESSGLASALTQAVTEEGVEPAQWSLLISREFTGGIRQIVVRGDKLAITRLTPSPAGASGPADVALAISRETISTIGYLNRLGYTENDRLNIIVIGSEAMRSAFDEPQAPGRTTTVLTPSEAASLVELAEFAETPEGHGDLLHAAWAAKKRRPTLQMSADVLGRRQIQMVAARKWLVVAMGVLAVVLGAYCTNLAFDVLSQRGIISMGQAGEASLKRTLAELQQRIDSFPDQPRRIIAVLEHHEKLAIQSAEPVPVLAAISDSLTPSIRLMNLRWDAEDVRGDPSEDNSQNKKAVAPGFRISLVVDLSAFTDAEQAIAATDDLAERLAVHFTDQIVEIVRPPLDILPTQTLVGFDSEGAPETVEVGLTADIIIDGRTIK
jgi:hypothetical protein